MAKNTFSEVLVSRMKDSSAHGLPNIARAKTVIGRAIWTILFLAGLALLTWQVCERCARYWSNEYGVNLDIRFDKEISFPAVTFCNMNPVRASQFLHLSADFQQLFAANSPPSEETRNEFIANGDVTSVLTGTSNSGGSTTETIETWNDRADPKFFATKDETSQLREDLTSKISNLTEEKQIELGHQLETLLLKCEWQGFPCAPSNFSTFYSSTYGNCFTFGRRNTTELQASHPGPLNGLVLELFVEQDEYLADLTDTIGLSLVVHEADKMPLPEDDGILISTGFNTAIGIKKLEISRLGEPYFECLHQGEQSGEHIQDYYVEKFNVAYSLKTCERSCYQHAVISNCHCMDPAFPTGKNNTEAPCSSETEKQCQDTTFSMYQKGDVACDCVNRCVEQIYIPSISMAQWPSDAVSVGVLADIMSTNVEARRHLSRAEDPHEWLERNVAKVQIFFEEFNYEKITQYKSYTFGDLLSDIGGQLGLWLGISVLSLFEVVEICSAAFKRLWAGMRKSGAINRGDLPTPIQILKPPID
ncbi:epithelial sodium channel subunit beta-like [Apostichopus japonicus]|uniref:epithelial sodium channel subunit beta-like n=1 Tax=Stichopus japonicus TaxID=307972 RepID=UPI003AB40F26